jgi:hypothetical protein
VYFAGLEEGQPPGGVVVKGKGLEVGAGKDGAANEVACGIDEGEVGGGAKVDRNGPCVWGSLADGGGVADSIGAGAAAGVANAEGELAVGLDGL